MLMNPIAPWMIVIVMVLGAVAVLLIVDFARRILRQGAPEPRKGSATRAGAKIPAWFWLFLIVAFATTFGLERGRGRNRNPARRPAHSRTADVVLAAAVGIPALLLVFVIGRAWHRHYDRDVSNAIRKATIGDISGAIEDMRARIAARGPTAKKLDGLGFLLHLSGDLPGALSALRDAYALDPTLAAENLAMATWKSGHPAEAEAILAPRVEGPNPQANTLLNYAWILLDLGRIDEAAGFIDRAERAFATTIYIGTSSAKDVHLADVARIRDRLAGLRGEKKDVRGFEEF